MYIFWNNSKTLSFDICACYIGIPSGNPNCLVYKYNFFLVFFTGNFDKRSPRCIANCMRQGLVHPIQCHSLCR